MSDLTKKEIGQDLRSRLRARLGQGQAPPSSEVALVLDSSGSMAGGLWHKLIELASKFSNFRQFVFSSDCSEVTQNTVPMYEGGGTSMHVAFMEVKAKGVKHIVLLTDGQPDSETMALKHAQGLIVDVIYIGPDPAPLFLEELAKSTNGQYGNNSLDDLLKVESKVRGLLGPSGERSIKL